MITSYWAAMNIAHFLSFPAAPPTPVSVSLFPPSQFPVGVSEYRITNQTVGWVSRDLTIA